MTQSSPTCFHGALDYLSKLTGISRKKEIILDNIEATRYKTKNGKSSLLYPAFNIFVIINGTKYWRPRKKQIKGGSFLWLLQEIPTDYNPIDVEFPIDTKFDVVGVVVNRAIEEFGIPIEKVGSYKDSLGGGWYTNCTMYKVGECYYVPNMECTCGN